MELLEIEKELAGPDCEAALARHDAALLALSERLDRSMRSGMAPDEFHRCEALADAVVVARKLLRLAIRDKENS